MSTSPDTQTRTPDCVIEVSASGGYILFRPLRPSASEEELIRRWFRVAELGRKQGLYRLLIDHSESPPPPRVDMDAAVLRNPEWREDERWRVALLGPPEPAQHTYAKLESAAEFVEAIRHEAAVFRSRDEAEAWLAQGDA